MSQSVVAFMFIQIEHKTRGSTILEFMLGPQWHALLLSLVCGHILMAAGFKLAIGLYTRQGDQSTRIVTDMMGGFQHLS